MAAVPSSSVGTSITSFVKQPESIDPSTFSSSSLTRTLSKPEQDSLLSGLNNTLRRCREGDYVSNLFWIQNPKEIPIDPNVHNMYVQIALIECLKGRLSEEEVATACLFRQFCKQLVFEPDTVRTYKNGKTKIKQTNVVKVPRVPGSDNIVARYTSDSTTLDENIRFIKSVFSLTDLGCRVFLEKLKEEPARKKVFYIFPLPLGDVYSWSPLYYSMNQIWPFFKPVNLSGERKRIQLDPPSRVFVLPSFTMIRIAFQQIYRDAVKPVPVLGRISTRRIEEFKRRDERVINLGFPSRVFDKSLESPLFADGNYTGPGVFSLHDFYHYFRWCEVPRNERKALLRIMDCLQDLQKTKSASEDIKTLKRLNWVLVDGELHFSGDPFGRIFNLSGIPWPDDIKRYVITDMVLEAALWENEFQLTRENLLPREQAIYDQIQESISPHLGAAAGGGGGGEIPSAPKESSDSDSGKNPT